MEERIKNIAVIINLSKPKAGETFKIVENEIKKYNYNLFLQKKEALLLGKKNYGLSDKKLVKVSDLVLAIGGDGTFINAAYLFARKKVPIAGIHIGGLGYLTEFKVNEIPSFFKSIASGKFIIEERIMAEAKIIRKDKLIKTVLALNEIVIHKGEYPRIIKFEAFVNESYIGTFSGDGLIIATPTGSTGYSLSIGGPIIMPGADMFIFNVISPHTLSVRPIILPANSNIEVKFNNLQTELILSSDGIKITKIKPFDIISVTKSNYTTELIRSKNRNFFDILREKFNWVK